MEDTNTLIKDFWYCNDTQKQIKTLEEPWIDKKYIKFLKDFRYFINIDHPGAVNLDMLRLSIKDNLSIPVWFWQIKIKKWEEKKKMLEKLFSLAIIDFKKNINNEIVKMTNENKKWKIKKLEESLKYLENNKL